VWALGYHQSRFSYPSREAVLKLATELRERNIPCDAIYLDIHYMDGFRPFTWSHERFASLRQLIAELHQKGFKVVAALNPGIKVDPQYQAYQSGASQDVFLKYPDGEPVSAACWAGISRFPDFTRLASRSWWVEQAKGLIELGVDGFSNGMSEPTVLTADGVRSLPRW
jgi:alpha-glucosidase